jgi:hypothetical protein
MMVSVTFVSVTGTFGAFHNRGEVVICRGIIERRAAK